MTTTYIPGTVDHPTQEDADTAARRAGVKHMNENLYEVASGVTDILRGPQSKKAVAEGSTVRLKSGGPSMVVMLRKADMALCQWHIENGEIASSWLQLSCLELVK